MCTPAERKGDCVDLVLPLDDRGHCGTPQEEQAYAEHPVVAAYVSAYGKFVHTFRRVRALNQAESFARSLSLYRSLFRHPHETLIVVRHDVQLLLPVSTWSCPPHRLGFAAYIDPSYDDPAEALYGSHGEVGAPSVPELPPGHVYTPPRLRL